MTRILLVVIVLAGCKTRNELSCEAPENAALTECTGLDGPELCAVSGDCSTGACKLPAGICVPCIDNTTCSGNTPTCNTTTNTCEACNANSDCASEACNVDTGACIDATMVAYVAPGGMGTTVDGCLKAAPCNRVKDAFDTTKLFIKIATGTLDDGAVIDLDHDVTVLADEGARITRAAGTPIIHVSTNAAVVIRDLEIGGGTGDAIQVTENGTKLTLDHVFVLINGGRGITSAAGSKITLRRCIVARNLAGGVNIQGVTVDMTNNLFVVNGQPGAVSGGVVIDPAAGSVFQFNTISDNASSAAATRGVNCVNAFAASSNIVTGNALATGCTFDHSLFDNFTAVLPTGTGNRFGDPKFAMTDPMKLKEATFYRINSGSDAIDGANPTDGVAVDIDLDPRPATGKDMGADELVP